MSSPRPSRAIAPRRSPVGLVVGVVLLVFGLAVLGWFGYQFVGSSIVASQAFDRTTTALEEEWAEPTAAPGAAAEPALGSAPLESGDIRPDGTLTRLPGEALAIMRVPAWGEGWEVPILDGTQEDVLEKGLGWYENTVGPGQVGNFAVAGHVVTHGQPFGRLADLPMGSSVEVETREAVYTYVLDSATEVVDSDMWVLDPVPGYPDQEPTEKLITLTTCADVFRSPDRFIVFGHLVSTQVK